MTIFHVIKYPISRIPSVADYKTLPKEVQESFSNYKCLSLNSSDSSIRAIIIQLLMEYEDVDEA